MVDTCEKVLDLRKRCGQVSLSIDSTIRSRSRRVGVCVLFINPTIKLTDNVKRGEKIRYDMKDDE